MSGAGTDDVEQRIARLEQQDQRLTQALELLVQRDAVPAGKPRRDWDASAAVIASFIGFLALAVSAYTAYVQREQLRAQVFPHLRIASSDTGPSMGWEVVNQGTGPAEVTAMRVVVNGAAVAHWSDVWEAAGYNQGAVHSTISRGWIPPGKEIVFVRPTERPESQARFKDLLPDGKHRLHVMLCYCSVLHDCWIATDDWHEGLDDRATTRDGCPITRDDRFLQ